MDGGAIAGVVIAVVFVFIITIVLIAKSIFIVHQAEGK